MQKNKRHPEAIPWHDKEFKKSTMSFKTHGPFSEILTFDETASWWIHHEDLGWLKMIAPNRPSRPPETGDIFSKDGVLFELNRTQDLTDVQDDLCGCPLITS